MINRQESRKGKKIVVNHSVEDVWEGRYIY